MEHRHLNSAPCNPSLAPSPYPLPLFLQTPEPALLASARPLSDIREATEPSLVGDLNEVDIDELDNHDSAGAARNVAGHQDTKPKFGKGFQGKIFNLRSSVPREDIEADEEIGIIRNEEQQLRTPPPRPRRNRSLQQVPGTSARPSFESYRTVRNRGRSTSPVRSTVDRLEGTEKNQEYPSRTYLKQDNAASHDILEHSRYFHPRISIDVRPVAHLFVGRSSVEGAITVTIDAVERLRHRKSLTVERVTVDLLGVEEISGAKKFVFVALGNELIDLDHPPPLTIVESPCPPVPSRQSWVLVPSSTNMPFLISLPLEVGPAPFSSKHARIRYLISATMHITDAGRRLCVRHSLETAILSVYDPEKALVSLPSPLTASDEYVLRRGKGKETVTVTAGLHRQVWVSGTTIFVDIHVANNSRKTIKRIELQLERIILCYRHAAAATLKMSASQARLFDQLERTIVQRATITPGIKGWTEVDPHTSSLMTAQMDLPRGHITVKCNKYFEVRFYLNVIASSTHTKLVTVQLPIVLIHVNSLDVPTNAVAQVAAAIDEKMRSKGQSSPGESPARNPPGHNRTLQGRAFAAPRYRSLERMRSQQATMSNLKRDIENSPRRNWRGDGQISRRPASPESFTFKTPPKNRQGRLFQGDDRLMVRELRDGQTRKSHDAIPRARQHSEWQTAENQHQPVSVLGKYSFDAPRFGQRALGSLAQAKAKLVSQKPSIQFHKPFRNLGKGRA